MSHPIIGRLKTRGCPERTAAAVSAWSSGTEPCSDSPGTIIVDHKLRIRLANRTDTEMAFIVQFRAGQRFLCVRAISFGQPRNPYRAVD